MKLKINFEEAFDLYNDTISQAQLLFKEGNVNCEAYPMLEQRYKKLRRFCSRAFPKDAKRGLDYCLNKFNFKTGKYFYENLDIHNKTKRGYYYD